MPFLAATTTVASATFHDLRRRPALLLACLAVAVMLLVVPQLCSRAAEESDALALQTGLSTISVFLMLAGGFAGLRAGAAEGDLSAAPEWRAAPLAPGVYVTGRFLGVAGASIAVVVALAPFLLVPQRAALLDDPPTTTAALLAAGGLLISAAQFAALGLLLASVATPQLAAVALVAALAASRTIVPELAARGGAAAYFAAVLPDPERVDLARELAFHRPIDAAATTLAWLAAGAHAAACLAGAAWALSRRET